jgi:hypothetical protein
MGQSKRGAGISRREVVGVLADPNLSLAAKGILAFVLTRPPGAVVTRAELFESNRDTIAVIDAAIKELAQGGFVSTVSPAKRSAPRRSGGIRLHEPPPPEGTLNPRGQTFGAGQPEPPTTPAALWTWLLQARSAIPDGGGEAIPKR